MTLSHDDSTINIVLIIIIIIIIIQVAFEFSSQQKSESAWTSIKLKNYRSEIDIT